MVIISQDKKTLINLDRITEIVVSGNSICVTDDISKQDGEVIATYETEERAKEVLLEISRSISIDKIKDLRYEEADIMKKFSKSIKNRNARGIDYGTLDD